MLSKLASLGRPVLLPIGRHLERRGRSMDPCAADCIVVPGSWVSKEGVPSGSLERRVHTALDHLALSLSGFVIFTGGAVGGRAVEAEVAARIARDRGLADDRSLVERSSRNTFENLRNARAIMRDHGLRTALVCSDAVHLPRCLWLARDVGLEAWGMAAFERDRSEASDVLASREAIAAFGYVAFWPYFRLTSG